MKTGGGLPRNALFEAPTCPVSIVWLSCGIAVFYRGKLQNLSFSKVSKQVAMSFCVADAALCGIPTCLITCRQSFLCGKRNTFASFSQDELQFSSQARHIGDL